MAVRDGTVGLTTTVPVEAVFAAGLVPVDLNNVFVGDPDPEGFLRVALEAGFPQNSCAWLKGIFGAVRRSGGPSTVIGVVRGDCSGTELMLEALEAGGVEIIPFTYPYPHDYGDMAREIDRLCARLGTTVRAAETWREKLAGTRSRLGRLDRALWEDNVIMGAEAHAWLVSSSDFGGDPRAFDRRLAGFLSGALMREPLDRREGIPFRREVRLGYIGVPPATLDVFDTVEGAGARFVFLEVQRQFSMPPDASPGAPAAADIVSQYTSYTYPYTVAGRAADINNQAAVRGLDGIVHYVQSFCHRNMEDVEFRRLLEPPVLTVECDCPGTLSGTALARLENFIQVLGENQEP